MALFRFKWLRKFIRKRMAPMSIDAAQSGKQKLSLLYAFFAWNAFGLVMYQIFKGKTDWAVHHGAPQDDCTPAQRYAKLLGMDRVKVIRFGKDGREDYEIDNRENTEDGSVIEIE